MSYTEKMSVSAKGMSILNHSSETEMANANLVIYNDNKIKESKEIIEFN